MKSPKNDASLDQQDSQYLFLAIVSDLRDKNSVLLEHLSIALPKVQLQEMQSLFKKISPVINGQIIRLGLISTLLKPSTGVKGAIINFNTNHEPSFIYEEDYKTLLANAALLTNVILIGSLVATTLQGMSRIVNSSRPENVSKLIDLCITEAEMTKTDCENFLFSVFPNNEHALKTQLPN